MIEMLGVLAIIGVLSAGGIMGYTAAMENYRINKTIDEIQMMAAGTGTTLGYSGRPVTGVRFYAYELHQMGVIPDALYSTGSGCSPKTNCNLSHAWKGPYVVVLTEAVVVG